MVYVGFQLAHIVAQVVEGLVNVVQTTDYDTEDNLIQMENTTIQSTQILTELVKKMQQMQTLLAQV